MNMLTSGYENLGNTALSPPNTTTIARYAILKSTTASMWTKVKQKGRGDETHVMPGPTPRRLAALFVPTCCFSSTCPPPRTFKSTRLPITSSGRAAPSPRSSCAAKASSNELVTVTGVLGAFKTDPAETSCAGE